MAHDAHPHEACRLEGGAVDLWRGSRGRDVACGALSLGMTCGCGRPWAPSASHGAMLPSPTAVKLGAARPQQCFVRSTQDVLVALGVVEEESVDAGSVVCRAVEPQALVVAVERDGDQLPVHEGANVVMWLQQHEGAGVGGWLELSEVVVRRNKGVLEVCWPRGACAEALQH